MSSFRNYFGGKENFGEDLERMMIIKEVARTSIMEKMESKTLK